MVFLAAAAVYTLSVSWIVTATTTNDTHASSAQQREPVSVMYV